MTIARSSRPITRIRRSRCNIISKSTPIPARRGCVPAWNTAVAGAAVALAQFTPRRLLAADAPPGLIAPTPSWVNKPMRWAQLTLVEDDPGKFDLAFWLDYFTRTKSDAVCLSGGGCVAYYPTQIPFHHRSKSVSY